jgi:hypothetical protein
MNGKTFLLGVGCQKGGTTWMHDYLSQSEHVDLGLMKEYHIFDHHDLVQERTRQKVLARLDKQATRKKDEGKITSSKLRRSFIHDPETYFDYFASLLVPDDILLTGDITPAYSGLSADRFRMIREGLVSRGIPVRVIFLMRDPLERIWSAARMKLWGEKKSSKEPDLVRTGDEALVLETYRSTPVQYRTNYHLTITALESVFAPEELHYDFYERLFTEQATRQICEFLRIPYVEPKFDKRVHTSPKATEISDETANLVVQAYSDVYSFAAERFGADLIAHLWPHYRYVNV